MSYYEVTPESVRDALLPLIDLDKDSMGDRFDEAITSVTGMVTTRLRHLEHPPLSDPVRQAAAAVVRLGAAAWIIDASYQANGSPVAESDYGSILWARYREELATLHDTLYGDDGIGDGGENGGGVGTVGPLFNFPDPPLFGVDQRH